MRILIDARYLTADYGGIRMYSEQLLEHLARADPENQYSVIVQPDYRGVLQLGENFRLIRQGSRPVSVYTVFGLHRLIAREKPDVFHALFPITPIFHRGPTVVTVHDLQPLLAPRWTGRRPLPVRMAYDIFYRWIYPSVFRRADRLICVSQATKDALERLDPRFAAKAVATPSGLPPEAEKTPPSSVFEEMKARSALPDRFILFIGGTRPNKNLPAMLRAFARLGSRAPSCREVGFVLVLTADRFMADIERVIEEENLREKVRVLPPVSPEEKRALNGAAEALFFATKLEGFGFPPLEAQAQGTPVLASTSASLPEIVGDSALLADADDIEAMAAALERLLCDEPLRSDLIAKGAANIRRFSWENAARAALAIYRELEQGKKQKAGA
jgi:glycosyltransferase involved in cell wall biosynthesis